MEIEALPNQLKNNSEVSIDIGSNKSEIGEDKLEFTETNLFPIKEKEIARKLISDDDWSVNIVCELNVLQKVQENEKVTPELLAEGPDNSHLTEMKNDLEQVNSKCMIEAIETSIQRSVMEASENELRISIEETANNDPITESESVNLVHEEVVVANTEQEVSQGVEIQETISNGIDSQSTESITNLEERKGEFVAAVAEWYRYRTVACFVTGSSPVPLKTRRVGQRCTLNLSRAETSSRWCGVVVRRGGASSGVVHVT
ncbi:uncharacterized protein TNCV_480651 [Trichonephila clavipes]|nr:uncharacterized protein TNCV_480651 [Trichonephila clavipes]